MDGIIHPLHEPGHVGFHYSTDGILVRLGDDEFGAIAIPTIGAQDRQLVSLDIDREKIDGLACREIVGEHLVESQRGYDNLLGCVSLDVTPFLQARCVYGVQDGRHAPAVKYHSLCLVRNGHLQVNVSRPDAPEGDHRTWCGVNVDATPAVLVEPIGV
jgi:hypothetical protein